MLGVGAVGGRAALAGAAVVAVVVGGALTATDGVRPPCGRVPAVLAALDGGSGVVGAALADATALADAGGSAGAVLAETGGTSVAAGGAIDVGGDSVLAAPRL